LGVRRAYVYPKVTEHIDDVINTVAKLLDKGFAYEADGNVHFAASRFTPAGWEGFKVSLCRNGGMVLRREPPEGSGWLRAASYFGEARKPWVLTLPCSSVFPLLGL